MYPSSQLCFGTFLIAAFLCTRFACQVGGESLEGGGQNENYTTIYVDSSGQGNYQTIQAAIDSVPADNKDWICIHIKAGTYREQVRIPSEKPYLYLKGESQRRTLVIWDGHDSIQKATFSCDAENILVKSITFINSYNYPPENSTNPRRVAVAAKLSGDKMAFHRCGFRGWQDTLWDEGGRHYFKGCSISGAVDFIFGNGQSIYESCSISVERGAEEGMIGYITAQGRQDPGESSGFVFKKCTVHGSGEAYLGRPWRDYARVIFFKTYMDNMIVPQGWTTSSDTSSNLDKLTFAEQECSGPGAERSGRVKWVAELRGDELDKFTSLSYIDEDGWLRGLPQNKLFV
ncbi:unnamed protein product [Cuscuta epithymum]|uniref:Pectinesterase n=1 Tax=Cuscuta epithymum TaxID=186058 RepID=A0AAV0C9B0_9ASTE|nr:unnamed protein product [Cuscuta epithymum]